MIIASYHARDQPLAFFIPLHIHPQSNYNFERNINNEKV